MTRPYGWHDDAGTIVPRVGPAMAPPRGSATWARLLGAAGMLALTVALYWLLTDDAFRVSPESVTIEGVRLADADQVRDHIGGMERSPNVFRVRASEVVRELQGLPGVSAASATVRLPASIEVHVIEREPIFVWSNGLSTWLVDEAGMLFAPGTSGLDPELRARVLGPPDTGEASAAPTLAPSDAASAPDPSGGPDAPGTVDAADPADPANSADPADPAAAEILRLPVVDDRRLPEVPPGPGDHLPAIDLAVMRQLLALTPELLSSGSEELRLSIDEHDGYVLRSHDLGWQAVFGHYTPTLQPPDVVPRQAQCLRWLLAGREGRVVRVRLVPSGSGCGTFTRVGQAG